MKKSKTAAVFAVSAAAAYLTYKAINEYALRLLVSNALDRKAPWIMAKMKNVVKGKKKSDPIDALLEKESARLASLELETMTLEAADGTALVAKYRPAPDAKRLIVAMHGWRTNWTRDFGALSDFLYENGCSVLYAVQRGQNESGGDHMGFAALEGSDCALWAKRLAEREGIGLPMYLFGVSMGASTVLTATEYDLPENVRGVIADCGFTSANDIWKHVVEQNLHLRYRRREKRANELCRRKIGRGANDCSTLTALASNKLPVLFIHGANDSFVPVSMTYENFEACKAPKRLLIVPGASHARSSWTEPEMYRKALTDFWNEYDDPSHK